MAHGRTARKRRAMQRRGLRKARVTQDALVATATGGSYPLGDRTEAWDAGAAEKSYTLPGDAGCYMVRDADGDAASKSSYHLPFVDKDDGGKHAVWAAITAVAGALSGARGGVQIAAADKAAAKSKVEGYYSKARSKYNDDGIEVPWKASGEASAAYGILHGHDVFYDAEGEYAGLGGDLNLVELVAVQNAAMARALAEAEYGTEADPAILAVAQQLWLEALAPGACANCDHAFADHLGMDGPCTVDGCSCNGYVAASAGKDDEGPEEGSSVVPVTSSEDERLTPEQVEAVAAIQASFAELGLEGFQLVRDPGLSSYAEPVTLPEEHQPGGRVPTPSSSPDVTPPEAPGEIEWTAIFCPEGKLTSDGRAFAPGSITWRDLPLSLMAMTETSEGGHIGAEIAGRIDRIWRDTAANVIRAQGVFADTDYGALIACAAVNASPEELGLEASLVASQTLRGVSVDLAIHEYEVGPVSDWFDDDGNWAPKETAEREEPSILDMLLGNDEPTVAVVTSAEIGMTTVCPFPAFKEAQIVVGDSLIAGANPGFWTYTGEAGWTGVRKPVGAVLSASGDSGGEPVAPCEECEGEALTASAAGLAPVAPPASWFEKEEPDEVVPWTVTDEGQVYGHAATWDVCHIGIPGRCTTAPHSNSDYAYFHLGEVLCQDGERVPCGQVTVDTGHPGITLPAAEAVSHYDHTGTVAAHIRAKDGVHGIWVTGAINPEASAEQVRTLRGAKLSGDWRKIDGAAHELVALLAVNVPGFPVPRPRANIVASAERGEEVVLALVAAGIQVTVADLTDDEREQFKALATGPEFAEILESLAA